MFVDLLWTYCGLVITLWTICVIFVELWSICGQFEVLDVNVVVNWMYIYLCVCELNL